MKVEGDHWLAGIFGYPVFRVTMEEGDAPETARRRIADGTGGSRAFLYAKVPTQRVDHVRTLTHSGFDVVDVNVTFDRAATPPATATRSAGTTVRDVTSADIEATLDVAERCFVYSRFHLDGRVPHELANRIKREWIDSYCHGRRGERLLVSETDGRISGFLAVLSATLQGKRASVIDLVGVDARFQRRGIGDTLVAAFIDRGSSADLLRVGTQAANIPSMRMYQKHGFAIAETTYVLHAHLVGGR